MRVIRGPVPYRQIVVDVLTSDSFLQLSAPPSIVTFLSMNE